jgi:lipopolysaccharide export system protein LptA
MKYINILLFITLNFLSVLPSLSEEKKEEKYIIEADKTEGVIEGDERVIIGTGHVKITHGKLIITCDKGTSYEKQELVILENNVVIDDKEQGYHLTSGYVEYHKNDKHSIATKSPVLIIKKEENPIKVESEMMEMFSKEDKGIARGNVWIYYEDIVAQCDLATYYGKEDKIILEGDPVCWQGDSRLAGGKITLFIKNDKADKIFVEKESRMIYYTKSEKKSNIEGNETNQQKSEKNSESKGEPSDIKKPEENKDQGNGDNNTTENDNAVPDNSINKTNTNETEQKSTTEEVKNEETTGRVDTYGDTMTAYFQNGEVVRVLIDGNAEGVYYPYKDEKATDEKVFASGDRIDVSLKDQEVERIRILGNATGYYDPGKEGGQTKAYGDTMIVFIKDGEVDRIIIRGEAKGIYYHGKEQGEEEKSK